MTDYVAAHKNPAAVHHSEALRLANGIPNKATFADGVMRWNANGCVPPYDVCEFAAYLGHPIDLELSAKARDLELDQFLHEYRRRDRKPSFEEIFEARAVHGPGVEIVNVFTGRTFRT
jgi:hypothetical protein